MPKTPKTQDEAIETAFVAGTLPEKDRRAPEVESESVVADVLEPAVPLPKVEIANEEISFIRERPDGVKVTAGGHILDAPPVAANHPPPIGPGFE